MSLERNPDFHGHEQIRFLNSTEGFCGFIVIHSTKLGPAAGGCRMAAYPSAEAALTDALRLSRGMSFKNAMAGLPAGGGKAVLFNIDPTVDRSKIFQAFGTAVNDLGGRYITAEDVGTTVKDMQAVARTTPYVAGLPRQDGHAGGDPSPWTALGVFVAMQAAAGRPMKGARVAVQGLGSVGYKLCRHLHEVGARLVVADLDPRRVEQAQIDFGAEAVSVEDIHRVEADVFSPNALGSGLNAKTVPDIAAGVICGGANNQLATSADGVALHRRGVVYVPDYVANAGGIINVMAEYLRQSDGTVEARVRAIGRRVQEVLDRSRSAGAPTHDIADQIAMERLSKRDLVDAL